MTWRVIIGSVLLAAFVAGTASLDIEPDALQAVAVASYVVGFMAIGYLGSWWVLPIFAVAFFLASNVYQSYFWHDDSRIGGIDDIEPMWGFEIMLPFVMVPIALGAVARQATRLWRHTPA